MPLFFRREELPSRRSATRLSILLERRCKLDRILRDLLQVHLVVFNGSVGGKLRLTVPQMVQSTLRLEAVLQSYANT